jgi:hypothetical protein
MSIERASPRDDLRDAVARTFRKPKASLTGEQDRFVLLHARRLVTKWQWLFQGATLRAEASDGMTATISATALRELIVAGVMCQGQGDDMALTDAGRALLAGRA